MTYRPDDFGPEARAWRARREAKARDDLARRRAERNKEAELRRQHDLQQRRQQRRQEFERRVDEAVAEMEREATLPLRERVRRAMLTGGSASGGADSRKTTAGPATARATDETRRRVLEMRRVMDQAMAKSHGPATAPEPPPPTPTPLPTPEKIRSQTWWLSARTADIRAAAAQAGYQSTADFVAQRCPFRRGGSMSPDSSA